MMKHKTTRTWAAMLAAVLALSLLTACGTGGDAPDPSPSNSPDITGPETTAPETPTDETPSSPEPQGTEFGTFSDGVTRYYGARCSFIMPEGWMCDGTGRLDDPEVAAYFPEPVKAYVTSWGEPYDTTEAQIGGESLQLSKWVITIIEYDDMLADFESVTAEEWYMAKWYFQEEEVPGNVGDLKAEMTTVDGNPAVRVTWYEISQMGSKSYLEFWAVNAPSGLIKINPFNGEVSPDKDESRAWTENFISTFKID